MTLWVAKLNLGPWSANFDPRAIIGTTFVEVHYTMSHAKYLSTSSEEDFHYTYIRKSMTPGAGQFWHQGYNLNNFCRGSLDTVSCQISKLYWFPGSLRTLAVLRPFTTFVCYGLYLSINCVTSSYQRDTYFLGNLEIKLVQQFLHFEDQLFKVTLGTVLHLKISKTWVIPVWRCMCNHWGPIWGNFSGYYTCRRHKKSSWQICKL